MNDLTSQEKIEILTLAKKSPALAFVMIFGFLKKRLDSLLTEKTETLEKSGEKIVDKAVDKAIKSLEKDIETVGKVISDAYKKGVDPKIVAGLLKEMPDFVKLVKPKDGAPGKSGETPSDEKLLSLIEKLIPDPIPGPPGKPGKPGKDGTTLSGESIIEKVNKTPINPATQFDWKRIKNVPKIYTQRDRSRPHGGGGSLALYDDGELVDRSVSKLNLRNGFDVSTSGDTTIVDTTYSEIPSGLVNGINTIFYVSERPAWLIVDGTEKFETTNYTYDSDFRRVELYTAPDQNIRAVFGTIEDTNGIPFTDSDTYVGTGATIDINLGVDMREEEGDMSWVIIKAAASGTDREAWWRFPFNWHRRADRLTTANSRGFQPLTFTSTGFRVNEELSESGVTYHYFAYKDNGSKSIYGTSYHGNATADRIIKPVPSMKLAAALIKRDSTQPSVWAFGPGSGASLARTWEGNSSDAIIGSDSDGDKITLGSGNEINQWNSTFGEGIHAICFAENNDNIQVKRYTGNGTSQTISLDWQAEAIFIIPFTPPTGSVTMRMWWSSLGSSGSLPVSNGSGVISGEITSVTSSGFTVGSGNAVNENGIVYGVIAIRQRTSTVANNILPSSLTYKSSTMVNLTDGYIDCGTDDSLSVTGAMTLIWEGSVSDIPLTLASIVNSGDINAQADTQFPLIFRSNRTADATSGAVSYGIALCAGQTTQPDVSTDPWLGATVVVATRTRWEMLYGGPATLDQFPMNTGIIQDEDKRTMIIAVHEGSGVWRVYKDRQFVKFRDRSVDTNITSNSGDRLLIGARKKNTGIQFPTTMAFHQAAIYDRALTHQECLDAMLSPFTGYPDIPDDYIERWKATDASGTSLPAEINSANNGTIYATGFDPTDIASLWAWYDFQDTTTITTSGGEITSMTDKSGNGRTISNSTSGQRPTYTSTDDSVGKYATFATARNDRLINTSVTSPDSLTYIAVLAPTSAGAAETTHGTVMGFCDGPNSFTYYGGGTGSLTNETWSCGAMTSPADRIGTIEANFDWGAGEAIVEIFTTGASGSVLRKNGGAALTISLANGTGISTSTNFAPDAYLGATSEFRVGVGYNGITTFSPLNSKLYDLYVFEGELTAAQINNMLHFISNRLSGLTVTTAS